ncbi:hypothetical protein [Bartonella pachyuromydis]|uniref:hypothetical protein n=1 Tax=Bartonella pachyuromydis TaxID=931097 RepID=UPI0031E70D4B
MNQAACIEIWARINALIFSSFALRYCHVRQLFISLAEVERIGGFNENYRAIRAEYFVCYYFSYGSLFVCISPFLFRFSWVVVVLVEW